MSRPVRWMLSVMSGVMLTLPWLGFPGWLLFAAFLPLLALDDFFVKEKDRFRSVAFWGHALLAFLIWNGLTTWWIVHATAAGAFVAIFLNAIFMSLVFWLAHLARRNFRGTAGYLAYVVFWISFEYAHYHWDIEWPWLTLGNGFGNNITIVQWYEFTGAFGGTLWVWVANILLFSLLKNVVTKSPKRITWSTAAALLLLVTIPAGWSFFRYHHYEEKGTPRMVLVIQPNIDPYSETHDEGAVNDKLAKFIRLAEANLTASGTEALNPAASNTPAPGTAASNPAESNLSAPGQDATGTTASSPAETGLSAPVDYIVGPETVFEQNWDEANLLRYPAFLALQELTRRNGQPSLVIGASTYRVYTEGDKVPPTARHSVDGLVYDVYNAAICTDGSGGYQVYHKSILVPGVEKMPFRKYLKFLDSFIINLGGTSGSLGIQQAPTNFVTPKGDQVATAICYESAFGGYLAEFVRKGAGAIFIITNDGWWKNTPGYRQHFSFARLRAVETRRCIARSANTGISGFISQRGEVMQSSPWWTEAALTETIRFNDKITFYVKNGDYIARVSLFMAVLILLNLVVARLIKGKKNPH